MDAPVQTSRGELDNSVTHKDLTHDDQGLDGLGSARLSQLDSIMIGSRAAVVPLVTMDAPVQSRGGMLNNATS